MFSLDQLVFRVVQAPMAGGPSTPELAAATARAGGLGFLAGGYLQPDRLRRQLSSTRRRTSRPIGVNLFVPQPPPTTLDEIECYRKALAAEADRYGVEPGVPSPSDDHWEEKLSLVMETRPSVVSFTFGLPDPAVVEELHRLGIAAMANVTSRQEALMAEGVGMDLIGLQGPEAGGHRATFDSRTDPATTPLLELLEEVVPATASPVIAAGGIATREDARTVREAGAAAVQAGTAFLLTPEAATAPAHRTALQDPGFAESVTTRAFSGRWARGLANEFTRTYDSSAPEGYPALNQITGPIRAAAAMAGDPNRMNLWAGIRWRQARAIPAYRVVHELAA